MERMRIVDRSLAAGPMKVKAAMLKRAGWLAGWLRGWQLHRDWEWKRGGWEAVLQVTSASSSL